MALGVCLLIVLYELFKIANMKKYINVVIEMRKVKGDIVATRELFNGNFTAKTFRCSELTYFVFLIYLLFTQLVWLSVAILAIMISSYMFSKNQKDAIKFTPYIDSALTILITLVMYSILT